MGKLKCLLYMVFFFVIIIKLFMSYRSGMYLLLMEKFIVGNVIYIIRLLFCNVIWWLIINILFIF